MRGCVGHLIYSDAVIDLTLKTGALCVCGAVYVGSPSQPPASDHDNHDNDLPHASYNVNSFTNTTVSAAADDDSYVSHDSNDGDDDDHQIHYDNSNRGPNGNAAAAAVATAAAAA